MAGGADLGGQLGRVEPLAAGQFAGQVGVGDLVADQPAPQLRELGVALAVGAQHPHQVAGEPGRHADLAGQAGRVDRLAGVDLTGQPGIGDPLPRRPRIGRPLLLGLVGGDAGGVQVGGHRRPPSRSGQTTRAAGRPALGAVLAALEALEGPFGLAAKPPLDPHCPPGRAVLGALAAGLLPGLVEGPQPDRGRAQVPVQQHPLPGPQPPQVLHRQQRPIRGRLVHRVAAVGAHRAVAVDQGLVADQPRPELQRGEVGQAGEEQLGPVVVQDRGGLGAVAGLQLALVMPDRDQLDALPPGGGGQHVQVGQGGAVARLVQEQPQPGRQHPVGGEGGLLLGGGHHLLGDRLEQRSEQPLLVGGGVQVDRVVPAQEAVEVQVVAVGRGADAFVAVDGQDLLGRGVQGVDGPVGAVLRRLPGIDGGRHPGRLQDGLDLLVLAAVEPMQDLGHAKALGGGGEQHGGEELGAHGLPEAMLGPLLFGRGLLDRIGQLDGGLLGARPGPAGGQRAPAGRLDAGGAQRVDHQHLAQPGPVGHGGPQQVRLDAGGDQGPGPFEDGGDDQGRGLVAAGGAEDQHRVAVLGRQQPAEGAGGAAQDHPARRQARGRSAGAAPARRPRPRRHAWPAGSVPAGGRRHGRAGAAGPRPSRPRGRRPGR